MDGRESGGGVRPVNLWHWSTLLVYLLLPFYLLLPPPFSSAWTAAHCLQGWTDASPPPGRPPGWVTLLSCLSCVFPMAPIILNAPLPNLTPPFTSESEPLAGTQHGLALFLPDESMIIKMSCGKSPGQGMRDLCPSFHVVPQYFGIE